LALQWRADRCDEALQGSLCHAARWRAEFFRWASVVRIIKDLPWNRGLDLRTTLVAWVIGFDWALGVTLAANMHVVISPRAS